MKKLHVFTLLFIFISSMMFAQAIQSGEFSASESTNGYTLHKKEGRRSVNIEVAFPQAFESKPEIVLSVNKLVAETKDGKGIRYKVEASAVSRDGFIIKIETWDDSIIWSIAGSWLAHAK